MGYLESLSSVDVPRDTETHRGVADGKTLVTTLTQAPGRGVDEQSLVESKRALGQGPGAHGLAAEVGRHPLIVQRRSPDHRGDRQAIGLAAAVPVLHEVP